MQGRLNNSLIRRFWFETNIYYGIGVSAYSLDDAKNLIEQMLPSLNFNKEVIDVIEDVNIRTLDQHHVIPNMGLVNLRGIWYPILNL